MATNPTTKLLMQRKSPDGFFGSQARSGDIFDALTEKETTGVWDRVKPGKPRYRRALPCLGLIAIVFFGFVARESVAAAPTLHEQLLASDAGLRQVDGNHSDVYRLLRNSLDKDDQQQLKAAQIRWINSLNQTLAQTPEFQRRQVVLECTVERTKTLRHIYDLRTGKRPADPEVENSVVYELIDSESNLRDGPGTNYSVIRRSQEGEVGKALAKNNRWINLQFSDGSTGWAHEQNLKATQIQLRPRTGEAEVEPIPQRVVQQQQNESHDQAATLLCSEIAAHWKTGDEAAELPQCLSNALVDRLEQLVPWSKTDHTGVTKGRYPNLKLAYAVHNKLIAKPLNLAAMGDLLDQGRKLNMAEVPWVGSFSRILEKRREKALALQKEALDLMNNGDGQAAESRMEQAVKEYPSPSLSGYSAALALYHKLTQDKALRAVDGDWKKPSLPDRELVGKATEQATLLRAFEGNEVLPALSSLPKALTAAGLLGKFASDYEPAGSMDQPHPIRALQAMRKSEKYRELQSDGSPFTKPFLDRMKFLDELIGPKAKDYEKLIDRGSGLEREGKYLDAATAYRLALGIEYSKELERTIHGCEAKTSGL